MSPTAYMELVQGICVILVTFRTPLAILLSATSADVRSHTGSTTPVSSSSFLNLRGFVNTIVKSAITGKTASTSSLPASLKAQLEYGREKYATAEEQNFDYSTNQTARHITRIPRYRQRDTNTHAAKNNRHSSTLHRPHKWPQFGKLAQDKRIFNTSPTLIRSLARMLNICSNIPRSQLVSSSLPSNDSSEGFQLQNHQVNPHPGLSKQQLHFKRHEKSHTIWMLSNITLNSRHKSKYHKSSITNNLLRDKRDIMNHIKEPKSTQFQVNGDKTRIDFIHVNSDSAGYDLTPGSSTPRPAHDFNLQVPTGHYPLQVLSMDNSGFTSKYSEIPTSRSKMHGSSTRANRRPGIAQEPEEDNATSLNNRSGNSSGLLTSPVPVSSQWCQELFAPYVARLYKLDCVGEEFKDAALDVRYFMPDVETIKLTNANFQRLSEIVYQPAPARVASLYLEDSNVRDVMDVFNMFDSQFLLTLILSNNSVEKLDSSTFSEAANLESLDLSHNLIQEIEATTFSGAPKLKYLFLRNNHITQLQGHVFHSNGRLQELHLDNNKITTINSQALAGLDELMTLYLSNNDLADELDRRPGLFAPCSTLQTLYLSHCQIGTLNKEALLGLTKLHGLDLSRNLLTHIAPGTFSELAVLNHLNLEHNQLQLVSPTWNLPPTLKILSLAGNQITDIKDGVFDGMDLTVVFLNSNKLQTLPPTIQMYLSTRNNVTLANNSWRCDCDLVYLIHYVARRGHRPHDDIVCASPRRMPMSAISVENITCPVDNACDQGGCTPCTRGLQRRVDAGCVCMEGTQPPGGLVGRPGCSACPAYHYKPEPGNGACVHCSFGSILVSGPSPVCACALGYYTNSRGDCEKCQPGTFKTYAGVGSCSPCTATSTHVQQCATDQAVPRQNVTTTRTTQEQDKGVIWPSITAAVGVLILIAVVILIFLARNYYSKQKQLITRYTSKTNIGSGSLHILDSETHNSHGSNSNSIEFRCNGRHCVRIKSVGNMVGRGAFGQVFEGYAYLTSHDKEPVKIAVKRLKDSASDHEVKSMSEELDHMLNIGPHPNIIGLYGSVFYDGQLCIVMEYAELGDLLTYLKTECASPLQYVLVGSNGLVVEQSAPQVGDNASLMLFAWQLAKGMCHLELHRFIHRDLAARNCLLTKGPIAKVSDFGLSKDAYELGHYKRVQKDRVPFKWLSPEALLWCQYSSKSDVWAFGILLYELYTFGGTPYPHVTTEQLRELHENGYRMPKPPACPEQLYRIMRACWRQDPRQRPSFKQLVQTLDNLIQKTNDKEYLELHAHGLRAPNPLPFTKEDMDDQKTSMEFVYRNKRLFSYESHQAWCDPPYDNARMAVNMLNKHDNLVYNEICPQLTDINGSTGDDISNGTTTTSGFQSMSSEHTV